MNGPKLWDKLLSEAPEDAVLMGGAVVDYMYGIAPRDFDIFHTYKVGEPVVPDNWKLDVNYNNPDWAAAHEAEYLQGVNDFGQKTIGSVYTYLVDGEHKVQLIGLFTANPITHFKTFDHSMTLGRYTKNGMFIHCKVFESADSHVIEYIGKDKSQESRDRSFGRAVKKAARYWWHDAAYKGFIDW